MKQILFILLLFFATNLYSQELKWSGEFKHKGAFSSSECPKDAYGNLCAVVDIVLPGENYEIECDMVVKSEKLVGRYRYYVCVPQSEKSFTIYTDGYYPLEIPYSSSVIQGGEIYQVIIYKGDKEVVQQQTVNKPVVQTNNQSNTAVANMEKGREYYNNKEYFKAVEYLQIGANQGSATAQYFLGLCYELGQGVSRNYSKAAEWYQKAADQGIAEAQYNLALCYDIGYGVEQNCYKAEEWYKKAADQGNASALFRLGYCYYSGRGVSQNFYNAVELFEKAANQDNSPAQYILGCCYYYGKGCTKSISQAKYWLQKAADQGNTDAQNLLNKM